ncbi:MAG: FAD-dependent oxidoreductase [Aquincola sp.]|nr:FAD-dependent oxidoreductase [Aquincola sp.]MDH4288487.1 FAD-dependent oxidoreductase [Aquincola sp.]
MLKTYTWPHYEYRPAPELGARQPRRVPLAIVGAGPVGLAAAIDAAQRGLPVLMIDEDDTVSVGSRGVCYAKRTLEIFDRLGVGERVVAKGVTWNVGRTFHGEREVFSFNLLPEAGHHRPGMVNLQQYHLEQYLVERAMELSAPGPAESSGPSPMGSATPERGPSRRAASIDLRWQHRLVQVTPGGEGVRLDVETPDGRYAVVADWLIAADGSKSGIRRQMGLDVEGKVFQDRFLIADIVLDSSTGEPFPLERTERRFWFAPRFHAGESALMHRQADNVWRIDFQLGWDADPEAEKNPERVRHRVREALDQQGFGHIGFELEWVSVYTFQCRRMSSFRHGRVLFVGDSAHQVSPFGARGANSGVQDADNLIWKVKAVLEGRAPATLLDSYGVERGAAADENILNSTRSTDFMTPKTRAARVLRDAVLTLAAEVPAGRALVNSGRLSVPTWLTDSPLNTPDVDHFEGWMVPGAPMDDAPVRGPHGEGWLLDAVSEVGAPCAFVLLHFGRPSPAEREAAAALDLALLTLLEAAEPALDAWHDAHGLAARRYDARPGTCYLIRPDQHVAARWRRFDVDAVGAALERATGRVQ